MSRILARLEETAGRFSRFLDRRPAAVLVAFSALYFPSTIWLASVKQLWSDELSTYYASGQPLLGSLWTVLGAGIENQPPAFFLVTRVSTQLGIDPQISTRLPEIFGFWMMSLLLFWYVARLCSSATLARRGISSPPCSASAYWRPTPATAAPQATLCSERLGWPWPWRHSWPEESTPVPMNTVLAPQELMPFVPCFSESQGMLA
ncbi:MAG: hypothetical protein ACE141_10310 [Bryobacteraceae bacterium]